METTPAMKTINGKQCVRVIDLAKAWDTTTSSILIAGKPNRIPEEYLHRIDGRVWCELAGLRYRLSATNKSRLTRHIREFLDSVGEKKTEPVQAKPCRDHVVRHQSASASVISDKNMARIQELSGKLDGLADAVHGNQVRITDTSAGVYAVKETANNALVTAQNAADLAQKNADIITVTGDRISLRLDRLSEHVDRVEKDAIAHRCDALQRVRQAERKQRDNTARIATLEEHARAIDWMLSAVAVLGVVGHVVRLLRR